MQPAPLISYATPQPTRPKRPLALLGIGVSAILAGTLFGAATNAINGAVSPIYFVNIMGWYDVPDIWWASVKQGMLEGSVVGFLFAIILTTTIGIITRATCDYLTGVKWLGYTALAILGLWTIGGLSGLWLASLHPAFFYNSFNGVPLDRAQMLPFAWVGGSIDGAELGGILAVVVALVLFRMRWRRNLKNQPNATPWR